MNTHNTHEATSVQRRLGLVLLLNITILACGLFASVLASTALALPADGSGNYTQILCADPASENGLALSGMPEGLSNPASIVNWQETAALANCTAGRMVPGRGVPMLVGQTNTYGQGTWSALLYQAPADATINGGTIYRAERAEGPNNGFMGIIQQGGEYNNLYSLPRNNSDQGDWFVGNIAARGTFSWPFSPENVVNLTISPDEKHWDVNATCDPNGNNNSSCTLTAGQWEYRLYGGAISLHAPNDPQVANISGVLTTDNPLHGLESITFSATDEGPGLAYIKLVVDGQATESQTMDTNDGHCVPVAGHDPYTWAYQVPCKTSLGGRTYDLNTTLVPDGSHHVQVIVEDAAGNQSIVLDRTVSVLNSTVSSLGALPGPGTRPLSTSPNLPLTPAGVPNGLTASESAQLRLGVNRTIRRTFGRRAFKLTGRLLDSQRHPISNANLNILQQIEGSAALTVIRHAKTRSDGTFSVNVPSGPSRSIDVAYRAFSADAAYTVQAKIQESVDAGVKLNITPLHTSSHATIILTGQVQGPIPRHGVRVELLVHYRGVWQPFRTPHSDRQGRWRVAYQFQGASGRFPFMASVPAGQAGFPFNMGNSQIINVKAS